MCVMMMSGIEGLRRDLLRCVISFIFCNFIHIILHRGQAATHATNYNHQTRRYVCTNRNESTEFDLNFRDILPATNKNESITRLLNREYNILSFYANSPLPINTSSDDYIISLDPLKPTNPFFNSRPDVNRITNKYISRIILGCYNNTDMDQILLDTTTRPFAIYGSSSDGICRRDGDYDFATIDIVQLLYVSREYPNSMPLQVYNNVRDSLLSINGPINMDGTYTIICQTNVLNIIRPKVTVALVDTENHILQTQISRYLSNQLLLEVHPDNQDYNNTANGNTVWLLQYLSTFFQDYFYEYNSRPYQLFTVKALTVLHSYANDENIVLVAEMLLDIITSYSAIQMNSLRRFVPYRRQPVYNTETLSWKGDYEYYRIALLVGNYRTFQSPDYIILNGSTSIVREAIVSTIASKYRINDFAYPLFFRGMTASTLSSNNDTATIRSADEYFISNHYVVEMYYSTPHVLISAGGHESKSIAPRVTFPNRFCLFSFCLLDGQFIRNVADYIYANVDRPERGWSRPTTIIPSNQFSDDLLDMIRFQGHRYPELGQVTRNLCVAPNFACGLQLIYGNVVEPILDACSIVDGNWRFIDFTSSNCLEYGYYMAVYSRSCIECNDTADNYGLVETFERVRTLTFASFRQTVLLNNINPFESNGTHTYIPIDRNAIEFEINPQYEYESQIIRVDGIEHNNIDFMNGNNNNNNNLVLDRRYRNWPRLWSSNGSFQSLSMVGRWTFDSVIDDGNSNSSSSSSSSTPTAAQRYICDVTDPLHPKRIITKLPQLYKYPIVRNTSEQVSSSSSLLSSTSYLSDSRYFDDSGSVLDSDMIQSIQFGYNIITGVVTGFRMIWRRSGFHSIHGSVVPTTTTMISSRIFGHRMMEYEFDTDESVTTVEIASSSSSNETTASSWFGRQHRRIHRIRMVTNKNQTITVGYDGTSTAEEEDMVVYDTTGTIVANKTENNNHHCVIAFYGWASDDLLYDLGVVVIVDRTANVSQQENK